MIASAFVRVLGHHIGALKSHDYDAVLEDMHEVIRAAARAKVKVILETSVLTHEEKVTAATLAKRAGAAFLKPLPALVTPGPP